MLSLNFLKLHTASSASYFNSAFIVPNFMRKSLQCERAAVNRTVVIVSRRKFFVLYIARRVIVKKGGRYCLIKWIWRADGRRVEVRRNWGLARREARWLDGPRDGRGYRYIKQLSNEKKKKKKTPAYFFTYTHRCYELKTLRGYKFFTVYFNDSWKIACGNTFRYGRNTAVEN